MDSASLSKLSVAQLKSKCKELKITGYSKLSKPLLIQKLLASTGLKEGSLSSGLPTGFESDALPTSQTPTLQAIPIENTQLEPQKQAQSVAPIAEKSGREDASESRKTTKKRPRKNNEEVQPVKKSKKLMESNTLTNEMSNVGVLQAGPASARLDGDIRALSNEVRTPAESSARATSAPSAPRASADAVMGIGFAPTLPLASNRGEASVGIPGAAQMSVQVNHPSRPANELASQHKLKQLSGKANLELSERPTEGLIPIIHNRKPKSCNPKAFKAPAVVHPPRISSSKPPNTETAIQPNHRALSVISEETLDFPPPPPCTTFSIISMPPSMARRREAERMSVVFSGIYDSIVLATCVQVCRTWRYAVHLSATHTLLRDFSGKRLESIRAQIKEPRMSSMWAYLRSRRREAATRHDTFQRTWLGRFFGQNGMARTTFGIKHRPVSWRMWTSPDDERQIAVALRFVSTRVVFALAKRHDTSTPTCYWLNATVIGADQIVPNEIWKIITARPPNYSERSNKVILESFHVVFDTGEVIGHAPSPIRNPGILLGKRVTPTQPHFEVFDEPNQTRHPLRADWGQYIRACELGEAPSLQDAIESGNQESYIAGISALWLQRVAKNLESRDGPLLGTIARRYVLSCVEPNSLSGEYKTAMDMAHEVAGGTVTGRRAEPGRQRVGLYISEHHLVESVHLSTCRGKKAELHPALALVFTTPGREYFVLRDTGIPIGASDEGLEPLWQKILGCDGWGNVYMRHTP